ncbi:hypothetical protein B0H19DRAFT_938852 [Mycena capillaripes]|nr:hypothetical protein B0H19DRAFT_938852 [Mycena capillaripes]
MQATSHSETGLNEEIIMSRFPTTPEGFGISLAYKMLSQLSVFFLFAQSVPALHKNHQGLVKEAPELLAVIASKLAVDGAEPDSGALSVKKSKTTSQKKAKIARRMAAQSKNALNPVPFEHLNMPVPETLEELEKSVQIVLATQRSILEAYLDSLRLPSVAASVRAELLPAETYSLAESQETSTSNDADAAATYQPDIDSSAETYPTSRPLKFSTLYRRRATGFGDWEINIALRAERDLREYNQRDRKTFLVIVKKMRDLSNGNFSPDNCKQINGGNVEVPIYEAKVNEELRLVYQVDCVPIYGKKVRVPLLKVFGIYQKAQLTRGTFWDSMSRELGKKGQEYKDRCALRQQSLGTEGYIFVPATFPAHEQAQFSPGTVPDLPSDDAEQVHVLLKLRRKTVHFSQELLNSILADRDVAFVLQISPRELDIIEHPHSCYVLGRSGTGKSTTMIYKMLMVEASSELSLAETRKIRQIFVTQSRILADKVGEHFEKLLGGYRPSAVSENVKAAKRTDKALIDKGEDNEWRSDLPKKYSDLQDTDFPLFVSFERLCSMIECDMLASGGVPVGEPTLTYDKFRVEYWPHFPQPLCKGFEPSMVFSEFMGVIMGSEEALTSESHYLDREVYLNVGERRQSTFADQREKIYDLFEKTHSILKYVQDHGVPGRQIDYLYVDETQDNLLSAVLRFLCQNRNGLFWAGDTAQTISVGSSFRFNELKAFLFRIEKKHAELNFHPAIPPQVFQLTVNYRSHAGIVNCAHSIIDVISKLWPNAIDLLEPERGTVDGLRPIFFTNWDSESVESKQFLFGDQPSGGYIELGAQQCILVRDNAAREKLRGLVGDIGIIMTLYESKGLEFNDVLLYNFFEDSFVPEAQWRVVLNAIENGPPAPTLDIRHASVCTELKFLYVAITRARNNIWIADCSTKGEPMRMLWTSRDQVQNCILGTDTPRFALSSTSAEWEERGRNLFDNRLFRQARLCYERAYMPHEAAVSQAYHLREEASTMPGNLRREIVARKAAFWGAAVAFINCANKDQGNVAKVYFRRAGECFESADDVNQAISAYRSAQYFNRVVELYRQLGKFDEAVATIQSQSIDPDIAERVIGVARLFYFNEGQIQKAGRLFVEREEALGYLEDRGMHGERAAILESLERFSDAAEIHLSDGRTSQAIALFLQDRNNERASDCVLQKLWERASFAVLPNIQDTDISSYLDLAAQVDDSLISQRKRDEVHKLRLLAHSFLGCTDPAAALLCLDHYFTVPPKIPTLPIEAVAENLQVFFTYVKLLHHVALSVDPCNSSAAGLLFGFRKDGENYSIPPGTFIHFSLLDRSPNETVLLTGTELRTILQRSLWDRFCRKIFEENEMCRLTKAFEGPCLAFAIFNGRCNRGDNCRQEHILAPAFDSREYNLRVRIHLQQILIYQGLRNIDTDQRRYVTPFWLSRLYAVLNPPSYQLGSAASLNFDLIPEAQAALQVVKEWVRGCVYTLEFAPEIHFLTRLVQLAQLGFQFDGRHAMSYLTHGLFMMDPRKPLMYRRPPEGQYVVAEFISALEDQHEWCLSAAVIFLRHIITSGLNINANVLCDVSESVCGGLVTADRRRFGVIHDITLPLSWLAKRSNAAGGLDSVRDTNTVWLFARALSALLEPIYSGIGAGACIWNPNHFNYLLFESKNLATLGYMVRNIFLARICKCLCLLAYNFRSDALREFVWQSITSLSRDPNRQFTTLISRYVHARMWPGLVSAVRASASGSTHDEMVQLLHTSRVRPRAVDGVRQIVYERMADIPRLLGFSSKWTGSTDIGAQTTDTVPTLQAETTGNEAPDNEGPDADEPVLEDVPIDMPAISEPEPPSEKELAAAAKIRKAYLQAHRRGEQRNQGKGKGIFTSALLEVFAECRGQALTMDRSHHLYRVYYCGPLPHLLFCLDIVHNRAQKEATQIRKELQSTEHDALENVDKKLTDVQTFLKRVIEIQKALEPTAEVHAGRNLGELKNLAGQAVTVLGALPFGAPPGLFEHLAIAYKGILQPRKTVTRRAEPKPKLNTDEEMY